MKVVDHFSAGIVLFKRDGVDLDFLLLQYPQGHWDFAKGHVEDGENVKETALRELEEETGLSDVEIIDGFLIPMFYEYNEGKVLHKKRVDYFLGELNGASDIVLSHEHIGSNWFGYEKSLEQLTFDNAKDILISAKSFISMGK